MATEIGAKDTLGRAYLALGQLHRARHRKAEAKKCLTAAMRLFEECEADACLETARTALQGLF